MDASFANWFVGLTDGEGCFRIHKSTAGRNRPRDYYACHFQIKLRDDDAEVLRLILKTLGYGRIVFHGAYATSNPQCAFVVQSMGECLLVAEIFDAYPLRSKKGRDYQIWREALLIWAEKAKGKRQYRRDWTMMIDCYERMKEVRKYRRPSNRSRGL